MPTEWKREEQSMKDALTVLRERCSCRSCKPDPIPEEILNKILEAGIYAAHRRFL